MTKTETTYGWLPLVRDGEDSGYPLIAQKLFHYLRAEKLPFATESEEADILLALGLPNRYVVSPKWPVIYHTMLEVTPLPAHWVNILNDCLAVWVPSTYCQCLFRESGVRSFMFTSGYGIDPDIYFPVERDRNKPLRFGVWGDTLISRKNVKLGVQAFLAAKVPDATLEVKISEPFAPPVWVDETGKFHENIPIHRQVWETRQVADWLRSLDVLIYLTAGEGFGLMILEAMACGVCVLTTDYTGQADFINSRRNLLVDKYVTEPAPSYKARFPSPHYHPRQFRPDFDQAVALIETAGRSRDYIGHLGQNAALAAAEMTWQRAARNAVKQLASVPQ